MSVAQVDRIGQNVFCCGGHIFLSESRLQGVRHASGHGGIHGHHTAGRQILQLDTQRLVAVEHNFIRLAILQPPHSRAATGAIQQQLPRR